MNNVNKTLYIPLYGKALVSRRRLFLRDPDAEMLWDAAGISLKGKSASKWLAYTMGMRSAVFDRWLRQHLTSDAMVVHLGCGLDSRCHRVQGYHLWFDVDFPQVIEERKRHFAQSRQYHMIGCDLRDNWLETIPRGGTALVVMEGVSMYLTDREQLALLKAIRSHFDRVHLLLDAYTVFGAKASKYKNPINDVGVTVVHGIDHPEVLEDGTGFAFLKEHDMTPEDLIASLPRREQRIFRLFFSGKTAKKFYRLYEYHTP